MAIQKLTQIIDRPIGEVFNAIIDVANFPRWNPTTPNARKLTPGETGEGTQFELEIKGLGKVLQEVREFRPNKQVRLIPDMKMVAGGHRFILTGESAAVSANHDNKRLFRARPVPLSQGSQDSQRAQVVRGEQAALQGRRPGAVPASDHGPRAGAQRDRRRIHRRSESQWRLYDAYLSRHTVFERQEPLQDVRRGALLACEWQTRGRPGIFPSSGTRQLRDRRRNLAARAQSAQKTSRQDRRRSQRVGPSDHGWGPWLNLPHGRRIAEAAASRLRPGSPVYRRHQAQGLRHQHSTDRPGSNRRRFPGSGGSKATRHRSFRAVLVECRRPALRCYAWKSSCPTWRAQAQRSPNTAAKCSMLWRPRRSWKATGLLARGRRWFVFQMKRRSADSGTLRRTRR